MGVMECSRSGCRNILCDLHVCERYVCNECAEEFREQVGGKNMSFDEFDRLFEAFMETEKGRHSRRIGNVDEYLDQSRDT